MLQRFWQFLARLWWPWRTLIKALLVALALFFALFPNLYRLGIHVQHLENVESLIQTNMPAMPEINAAIDQRLTNGVTRKAEFKAVERFVYEKIRYQYDWFNWGNVDYWPTAQETWDRKREDCDGRAILAASILRSRGYTNAEIVANIQHVWVKVGDDELMGPMAEKNLKQENGHTVVTLPSWKVLLDGTAMLCKFPIWRTIMVYLTLLTLVFHPHANRFQFAFLMAAGLIGWLFFFDWAGQRVDEEGAMFTVELVIGSTLILASVLAACVARRWSMRFVSPSDRH